MVTSLRKLGACRTLAASSRSGGLDREDDDVAAAKWVAPDLIGLGDQKKLSLPGLCVTLRCPLPSPFMT